jgi:hypothetical protein
MTETVQGNRAVVLAGFRFAMADLVYIGAAKQAAKVVAPLLKALKDGESEKAIRHDFQIGDMARRMAKVEEVTGTEEAPDFVDTLWARARIAFYAQAHGTDDPKPGHPIRTKKEEQGYTASRAAWMRMKEAAGLKEKAKPSGARAGGTTAGESEAREESAPLAKDKPTANKWLAQETGIMNAFVLRNKEHVPETVIALVDQFRKDLLALLKD